MPLRKKRIKKGIQQLSQDDLQLLNIYKQAYQRSYEDERLKESGDKAQKQTPEWP